MTLLEALVSTAIIGIGFVAVFQMVQYSVRSIDISGERTKATFLTGMVAEDLISEKHSNQLYRHRPPNRKRKIEMALPCISERPCRASPLGPAGTQRDTTGHNGDGAESDVRGQPQSGTQRETTATEPKATREGSHRAGHNGTPRRRSRKRRERHQFLVG